MSDGGATKNGGASEVGGGGAVEGEVEPRSIIALLEGDFGGVEGEIDVFGDVAED